MSEHTAENDACPGCGEKRAAHAVVQVCPTVENDAHVHEWVRHQNVTTRGTVMPAYEACECGAARSATTVATGDEALIAEAREYIRWAGEDSWGGQVVTDLLARVFPPGSTEEA